MRSRDQRRGERITTSVRRARFQDRGRQHAGVSLKCRPNYWRRVARQLCLDSYIRQTRLFRHLFALSSPLLLARFASLLLSSFHSCSFEVFVAHHLCFPQDVRFGSTSDFSLIIVFVQEFDLFLLQSACNGHLCGLGKLLQMSLKVLSLGIVQRMASQDQGDIGNSGTTLLYKDKTLNGCT